MFNRKLISISIASALLTSSLTVSANTQKDDDEDSVNSWGKWAQQYATAAGGEFNTNSLNFASLGQGETGRNGQNEPGFTDEGVQVCQAGSICGFTTIIQHDNAPVPVQAAILDIPEGEGQVIVKKQFGREVGIITGGISSYEDERRDGPGFQINYSVSGNEGFKRDAIGLLPKKQKHRSVFYAVSDGQTERDTVSIGSFSGSLASGRWSRQEYDQGMYYAMPFAFMGMDYGWSNIESGRFVGGMTPSLAQLNDYVNNLNVDKTASFSGGTLDYGRFNLTINFANNTWGGEFNRSMSPVDNSFSVNAGKVEGVAFTATSANLSAVGASVEGIVSGAMFTNGGSQMDVAGMVDIKKTIGDAVIERKTIFASQLIGNQP